jgi:peptidoglycan hydrolase-like protein with peptidoglycan-binding domain
MTSRIMRNLLGNKGVCGVMIAALAAATGSVPAFGTQSPSQSPSRSAAHKSTSHGTAHSIGTSTKTNSTSTAKTGAAKSSTTKTASGKGLSRKKSRTKKVKGQQTPTADRISQIQEALASKGAFSGTPTGTWDDSTMSAVKKFQSSNGLTPTGKLDALTLQKLGLGSETAGVAPPIVPPDAENRLRSSSTSAPASAEPR